MANADELDGVFRSGDETASPLRRKIRLALLVAADDIRIKGETATAEEKRWAKRAYADPDQFMLTAMHAAVTANRSVSVSAILAANETTVQNNINSILPILLLT